MTPSVRKKGIEEKRKFAKQRGTPTLHALIENVVIFPPDALPMPPGQDR
jgi:hypothetical protein